MYRLIASIVASISLFLGTCTARAETRKVGLAKHKAPEEVHDRLAVLECLTRVSWEKAMPDVLTALGSEDLKYRTAACRIALGAGRLMQKTHPDKAIKLLQRIVEATREEAVRQQAETLLGRQGK